MPSRTTSAGFGGGGGARVAVRRLSSRVTFGVRVKPVAPGTYAAKDRPSSIIRDALSPSRPAFAPDALAEGIADAIEKRRPPVPHQKRV